MGIGHPPRNRKDRRFSDNVVSLRHPGDEFFDLLSPLLEEAATAKDDDSPRQGLPQNVLSLSRRMPGFARLQSGCRTCSETSLFAHGRMPPDPAAARCKRLALRGKPGDPPKGACSLARTCLADGFCPTGKSLICLSSPSAKIFRLCSEPKSPLYPPPSRPTEGRSRSSRTRGGMRWTLMAPMTKGA